MRLSVDKDDPGHIAYAETCLRRQMVVVRCNGIELHEVVTADTDEGIAIVLARCEYTGEIIVYDDEIALNTLRGEIEIELMEVK